MMPKFYDYIVAEDLAGKTYTEPHAVTTANFYLYLNEDTMVEPRTASRGGNILRERVASEFKVFCNSSAAQAAIKNEDILTWYKERQLYFPMLSHLTTIIFQYLPLKLKIRGTSSFQVFITMLAVKGYQ